MGCIVWSLCLGEGVYYSMVLAGLLGPEDLIYRIRETKSTEG